MILQEGRRFGQAEADPKGVHAVACAAGAVGSEGFAASLGGQVEKSSGVSTSRRMWNCGKPQTPDYTQGRVGFSIHLQV
jgi:hypothetical protein